jgi:hypothetical protein
MDIVLLTLTTLSLVAAAGFGFLSWRTGREEREREQARIAALATAMSGPSGVRAPFSAEADTPAQVAVGSMFDRATEGLRGRPAIKAAVIGAMVVTIVVGAMIGARMSDNAAASPAPAPHGTIATKAAAPLELMSMRHERQGTTLTVTGLVRNPPQSVAMNGITAVVFAFDRAGAFIASGRAALDVNALGPGDQSPFTVTIPHVSDVARYRVTFRSSSGVVRHIDRRSNQVQLAQAVR